MSHRPSATPAAAPTMAHGPHAWLARWAAIVAALFLVNLMPSFHNVWPTPWITLRPELSVEAAAIVLLVVVVAQRYRVPSWLIHVLALVLMCLALARYLVSSALSGRLSE